MIPGTTAIVSSSRVANIMNVPGLRMPFDPKFFEQEYVR